MDDILKNTLPLYPFMLLISRLASSVSKRSSILVTDARNQLKCKLNISIHGFTNFVKKKTSNMSLLLSVLAYLKRNMLPSRSTSSKMT